MNEFARRMANGASSAAMGGTTGAAIGLAVKIISIATDD